MSQVADVKVAKRYASALFSTAGKLGKTDAVLQDLNTLGSLWKETPALQRAMESPLIPSERKRALIDELLSKQIDLLTRQFLYLLVEKRREPILETVREDFQRQFDEARGLLRAQAVVAAPLDDAQRAALIEGLRKRTGKQIELNVSVDSAILGGVVVRMQDTVIDGSVRGALERLRVQMLHER